MPELPEVETTLRGIEGALLGQKIRRMVVRNASLRWPIPDDLAQKVKGQQVIGLNRRAKYILIKLENGHLIWHLGMSGSMRIVGPNTASGKHDHVDLETESGQIIRYNDPRRFGCVLWGGRKVMTHPLLVKLGPEPLHKEFNTDSLFKLSHGRKAAVKNFIMDQKIVVGVGNIYASEALFLAGISPLRQAGRISKKRYAELVDEIKAVLARAIKQGGTSLKDFSQTDGQPGYFEQQLLVYGREGQACTRCNGLIHNVVIGQRASFYCKRCQR